MAEEQPALFSEEELCPWAEHWRNMPEYSLQDLAPKFSVIVNFACAADVADFAALIGQTVNPSDSQELPSVWYPPQDIGRMVNKRYIQEPRS